MKKRNLLFILPIAVTLILEILPFGAVLNFAQPDKDGIRTTYSYFSLLPFGYANFGPFPTAILTLLLLITILLKMFTKKQLFKTVSEFICFFALGTSLMPLLLGTQYYTVIGFIISLMLACELALCLFEEKIFTKK